MEKEDLRQELTALVASFSVRLRWLSDRGLTGVPDGPAPRRLPLEADTPPRAAGPSPPSAAASRSSASFRAGPPVPSPDTGEVRKAPAREGEAGPDACLVAADAGSPLTSLEQVRVRLGDCQRCRLASTRTHIVFGTGDPGAQIMWIGEAPGRDEDLQGEPFVGAAGQLLDRMIRAMGLEREEVYIGNIIKCRPPRNRNPAADEIEACEPFLLQQIDAIGPRIIIALGNFAAKTLLRTGTGITRLRGQFHTYHGLPLMPTFHPAYLLRNTEAKRDAWHDLQVVMAEMDKLGLRRRSQR